MLYSLYSKFISIQWFVFYKTNKALSIKSNLSKKSQNVFSLRLKTSLKKIQNKSPSLLSLK